MRIVLLVFTLLVIAGPASAQRRDLPVPTGKGWKHADSGVILTATLDGLPRTTLTDDGTAERDVIAEFASKDRATIATVYIFHPALLNAGIWFDRAQTAIELRDVYAGARPVAPFPTPFARPDSTVAAGLRQVYAPGRGIYRSTALAVMPTGDWLVVIRLSSTTLDPAAADVKLTALVAAIRWPTPAATATPARVIGECAEPLAFHEAKQRKADMMQALLGASLSASVTARRPIDETPVEWCRDPGPAKVEYGVYHVVGRTDGYTLAIADSGRIAGAYPAFALPNDPNSGGYAVSYTDLDGSVASFPSFDALPRPQQVFDLVMSGHAPVSRATTDGKGHTNIVLGLPSN